MAIYRNFYKIQIKLIKISERARERESERKRDGRTERYMVVITKI